MKTTTEPFEITTADFRRVHNKQPRGTARWLFRRVNNRRAFGIDYVGETVSFVGSFTACTRKLRKEGGLWSVLP